MSIKKGNRKRTRRDYWFAEFVNFGFCPDWKTLRRAVRNAAPKAQEES